MFWERTLVTRRAGTRRAAEARCYSAGRRSAILSGALYRCLRPLNQRNCASTRECRGFRTFKPASPFEKYLNVRIARHWSPERAALESGPRRLGHQGRFSRQMCTNWLRAGKSNWEFQITEFQIVHIWQVGELDCDARQRPVPAPLPPPVMRSRSSAAGAKEQSLGCYNGPQ